jgi:hypothetical protein
MLIAFCAWHCQLWQQWGCEALALQSVERKPLAGASAPVKLASVKQKKHDLDRNVRTA